jgi:anti-sigma B factor antagonist
MERVRFIDSAGLGELVASLKRVREAGGDLKLSDVTQRVSEALVVTQLVRILDVYESESDAVATYV